MKKTFLMLVVLILLSGCYPTDQIEDNTCKKVSIMIQDELKTLGYTDNLFKRLISIGNTKPAACMAVELGWPTKKNYWHSAVAYLNNGYEVGITVKVVEGHVYVTMKRPFNQ